MVASLIDNGSPRAAITRKAGIQYVRGEEARSGVARNNWPLHSQTQGPAWLRSKRLSPLASMIPSHLVHDVFPPLVDARPRKPHWHG